MIEYPNEREIKRSILQVWREQGVIDSSSTLASEFVLGRSRCRADLTILNDQFIGIEIKSRQDNLSRLERQLTAYTACFDRVIVVADEKHIPRVLRIASDAVEIWRVVDTGTVEIVRNSNRSLSGQCPLAQLQLLKLNELSRLVGTKERLSRHQLEKLALERPGTEIRHAALCSFKSAFSGVSRAFWESVDGRQVSTTHLNALSRFGHLRLQQQAQDDARSERLRAWNTAMSSIFNGATINPPTPPLRIQVTLQQLEHVSGC